MAKFYHIADIWIPILLICMVTTVITMGLSGWSMQQVMEKWGKSMDELINTPMFGILLSLLAFEIGLFIQKKTKLLFLNPLLIAIALIIIVLLISNIPLESYQLGGDIINLFLGPATVVLAVPLYQQLHNLKNYFVPIMIGICVGILVGMISTISLCLLTHFDADIIASLVPKSITTPIELK